MDIQMKVAVVIANDEGLVLLIKEKLGKNAVALWNVVKGSLDEGETPQEAAVRECFEETGIRAELTQSLGVYISQEAQKLRIQCNYLAHMHESMPLNAQVSNVHLSSVQKQQQELRGEYIEEMRWFGRSELVALSADEFVSNRSYQVVQDYVAGKIYPLDVVKNVTM